jgi:hypothetical protein
LFFIMQVWVPDLEHACGHVPCKYGIRCTLVAASPVEAFTDLASAAETYSSIVLLSASMMQTFTAAALLAP